MNAIQFPRTKVLVQYAEPLLSFGLAAVLRTVHGLDVHAPAAEPDAELPERFDVVVTDYLGGTDLLAMQRRGTAGRLGHARVLIVAAQDRENEVRVALERGVHGYLLLGCAIEELARAVTSVARGSKYLCMEVAQRMADSLTREALTARETDVLQLLAKGDCNKSIARRLNIAIGTVKAHVKSIMCKLDAASRTQAVTIASHRGLVEVRSYELSVPMGMPLGMAFAASEQVQYA